MITNDKCIILSLVAFCVVATSVRAQQFEVDFAKPGNLALRDTVSGVEMQGNAQPFADQLVETAAGQAWHFDEGTRATFPIESAFVPPMTVEMWFCPTQRPLGPVAGLLEQFAYHQGGFRLAFDRTSGQIVFKWDTEGAEHGIKSEGSLDIGRWQHLAVTISKNDTLKIYINGKLDTEAQLSPGFTASEQSWMHLGRYSGRIGPFVGLMRRVVVDDDVRSDFSATIEEVEQWNNKRESEIDKHAADTQESAPIDFAPEELLSQAMLSISFDGNLNAQIDGNVISPENVDVFDISKFGQFVRGMNDKAFELKKHHAIQYSTPTSFPSSHGGTICFWVQPADWFSPANLKSIRKNDWARRKVVLELSDMPEQGGPWVIEMDIAGDPTQKYIRWRVRMGGQVELFDEMQIEERSWYFVAATWMNDDIDPKRVRAQLYINGQRVDEALGKQMPSGPVGDYLYLGSTNPGIAYDGAFDDFYILDVPLSSDQVLGLYQLHADERD